MLERFCIDAYNGRVAEVWIDPRDIVRVVEGRYGRCTVVTSDGKATELLDTAQRVARLVNQATAPAGDDARGVT